MGEEENERIDGDNQMKFIQNDKVGRILANGNKERRRFLIHFNSFACGYNIESHVRDCESFVNLEINCFSFYDT
jgi:hypothetical protein